MQAMKKRLGDILVELGGVDGLQLQAALAYQRTCDVRLGQVMVDLRFCSPEQVLRALSLQAGVPVTDLAAWGREEPVAEKDMFPDPTSLVPWQESRERVFSSARSFQLPDLTPPRECLELSLLEPVDVEELVEILELTELAPPEVREEPARVLVHGWSPEVTAELVRLLGEAGFPARVVEAERLLEAEDHAVVLAPLPSLEELERLPRAQLLVAGKEPERDVLRAQALGARGFLAAPLDLDLTLRAVNRLVNARSAFARTRARC